MFEGAVERLHLFVAQAQRGRDIARGIWLERLGSDLLHSLHGSMQDDVRVAGLALELKDHGIVAYDADRRKIHRDLLAALRTAHLLPDALQNLLEGVGI